MSEFAEARVGILNASGAIALSVAEGFLKHGAKVAAIDRPEVWSAASEGLPSRQNDRLAFVPLAPDPVRLLDACEKAIGPLDILVCAAPPVGQVTVLDMTTELLRRTVDDELVQPALLMQEAGRRMAQRGVGRIISLFSMSAKTGVHTKVAPFAAAKGGLLAYTRVMAAELAPMGVTVNAIATSLFEPQVAILEREEREALSKAIPVRRFGRVTEAAHAVFFLASKEAGFVTGETLNLSGGRFMD